MNSKHFQHQLNAVNEELKTMKYCDDPEKFKYYETRKKNLTFIVNQKREIENQLKTK